MLLVDLYKLATGQLTAEDLVMVQESEEASQLKRILTKPASDGGMAP
jgi:hypothetical protein